VTYTEAEREILRKCGAIHSRRSDKAKAAGQFTFFLRHKQTGERKPYHSAGHRDAALRRMKHNTKGHWAIEKPTK
jgi:hypothetical protein